jgi:hypothetical protein
MRSRFAAYPLALALALSLAVAAPAHAASKYSAAQLATVQRALQSRGVPAATIDRVLADDSLAAVVIVSQDTEVTSGTYQNNGGRGMLAPMNLGSGCVGTSKWVQLQVNVRSLAQVALGWFRLKTTWCYTSTKVTFAANQYSGGVTTAGTIGGVSYEGLASPPVEYFYNYVGTLPNSGAYAWGQAKFTQSPFHIGTLGSVYPTAATWVHYNGTYGTQGTCDGC